MSYQPAPYYLVVLQGPGPGTAHTLQGQMVTIGRQADNDVVVNDHRISRHHAQLTWRSTTYLLEDLGSANGTWVNNARITAPVTLQPGDVIGISQDVQLLFSDQPDASDRTMNLPPQAAGQPSPAGAGATGPRVAQPPAPPLSGTGQGMMAFGVGGLIALLGTLALVVVAVGVYLITKSSSPSATVASVSPTAEVTPTETPDLAPTSYPTYTPYPTFTSIPTEAATPTPYPTYTLIPTEAATVTPYPTYTPYPTAIPTATPIPTYTPYPTYTPPPPPPPPAAPPQPKALPTDTPQPPTATPEPPFTVALGRNRVYEPWGNPGDPGGCQGPYDDRIRVQRFTLQLLVTNNSSSYTQDKWLPTFVSASGASLPSCIWYYNNTVIEPGETVDVTFATHLQGGDYVKALVLSLLGQTVTICLDPGANEIPCK